MARLSDVLWRERDLLESLLSALEVEQRFLTQGPSGSLTAASADVEAVRRELRRSEILRAVVTDEVAAAVGLDPDPSLRDLSARAGDPWGEILADHRSALLAMTLSVTESPGPDAPGRIG